MSLQESLLLSLSVMVFSSLLWKWNKVLLVLVNLELLSIYVFISIMLNQSNILLLLMVFFVGEALIMLSAFFFSMRIVGASNSLISLW